MYYARYFVIDIYVYIHVHIVVYIHQRNERGATGDPPKSRRQKIQHSTRMHHLKRPWFQNVQVKKGMQHKHFFLSAV